MHWMLSVLRIGDRPGNKENMSLSSWGSASWRRNKQMVMNFMKTNVRLRGKEGRVNGEGPFTEDGQLGRCWEKRILAVLVRGISSAEDLWQEHAGLSRCSSKETCCSGGEWARGKMMGETAGQIVKLWLCLWFCKIGAIGESWQKSQWLGLHCEKITLYFQRKTEVRGAAGEMGVYCNNPSTWWWPRPSHL